jgi:anti-sigma regulatory factor (Ser/Thr protein kinase)
MRMSLLRFECQAVAEQVALIDQLVESILASHGVQRCNHFAFAAHELVINSVEAMRACGSPPPNHMVVHLEVTAEKVLFSITDRGGGLPSHIVPLPDMISIPADALAEHGRGLHLVQTLVDRFMMDEEPDGCYTYTIEMSRGTALQAGSGQEET